MNVFSFYQHHECQKEVLRRQVKIALEFNLPLVIHSRDSEQDTIDELEKVE
jgi:Tat protein secretion system quality control protein TatD with DNase activity